MKEIHVTDLSHWRTWLAQNHEKETQGIWLIYYKKETGKPSLDYEASVEEALCYGWIDSIIRKIDDERYCRKFTPRKDISKWSALNKKRVDKLIKESRMTVHGLKKIEGAKKSGKWMGDPKPDLDLNISGDFASALKNSEKATAFFDQLAPSYQKHFIGWITVAKRPETKEKRIRESIALLEQGKKLGLK